MILLSVAACRDATGDPARPVADIVAPIPTAPASIEIPTEGQPTYYEYTSTISGSGGLPGWVQPSEAHSRTIKEIYSWSATTGFWNVENQYLTPTQWLSGFQEAAAVDVANTLKKRNSIKSTSRTAAQLSVSSRPPIDRVQQGIGPAFRMAAARGIPSADTIDIRAVAPTFTEAEEHASRADRVVMTKKGAGRELALLIRQFGPGAVLGDRTMEFRKTEGQTELRLHYDPAIGGVTRLTRMRKGVRVSEIERRYKRQDGYWVLGSVETRIFDEKGRVTTRLAHDISNIVMR